MYTSHQGWGLAERIRLRERCQYAAFLIASDRVSRFLPSVATTGVSFIQLFSSFWKTLDAIGDTYEQKVPASAGLNRTPHNIAFGALFFWLPFVVLLTAVVGGSQTSHLVGRVLEDFRKDYEEHHGAILRDAGAVDELVFPTFPNIPSRKSERWSCGGLPVWQAEKIRDLTHLPDDSRQRHTQFAVLAIGLSMTVVAIPTGCAMAISWLTPTEGFGCRGITQLAFFVMWVLSAMVDAGLAEYARPSTSTAEDKTNATSRYQQIYWITFVKDFIIMVTTVVLLTFTALGIFNNCECWCKWPPSTGYISFPQDDAVFSLIKHRLQTTYLAIVGVLC